MDNKTIPGPRDAEKKLADAGSETLGIGVHFFVRVDDGRAN